MYIVCTLILAGGLAACSSTHPCRDERCDGVDNDCDGKADEDFVDDQGRYVDVHACGSCGIDCDEVHPTAAATECAVLAAGPACQITSCGPGERLAGGACVPETDVLCLPCTDDGDCERRSRGARCVVGPDGAARCGSACGGGADCPAGFRCVEGEAGEQAQCLPESGGCACTEAMEGASFGCEIRLDDGTACAGVQRCGPTGLGPCEASLSEQCNGLDDDCDGATDEDFVDDQGRYVSADHCGACGAPCANPGPHLIAECIPGDAVVSCSSACEAGFVDVDGIMATGCECALMDGPAVVIGGDTNCDGIVDPTPELVFVSAAGDDGSGGTDFDAPVATLQRGLQLAAALGRDVLVARGIYTGPLTLAPGVSVYGGYSPDFSERNVGLHQVLLEAPDGEPGAPVLRCQGITQATTVDGLTVHGTPAAEPGAGSTAVYLDGCGPGVVLSRVQVVAARAQAGLPGEDSSAGLAAWGLENLGQLAGVAGYAGRPGGNGALSCEPVLAGFGGDKQCFGGLVSGGDGGDARCPTLPECDNDGGEPCPNAGCEGYADGPECDAGDIAQAEALATPNPPAEAGLGAAAGAAGDQTYNAPTNRGVCYWCDDHPSLLREGMDGGPGAFGADGDGGAGCGMALPQLDPATGVVAADGGADGGGGGDGSGGGGGSAGAGYAVIANTVGNCIDVAGGSGGGGGSGGCGAPGATGGQGGGASVGVLVRLGGGLQAGPSLRNVSIVTASGGDGGDGGAGAEGGVGGGGGGGGNTAFWCARDGGRGGDGGDGGDGGAGGGGCGGGSFGVLIAARGAEASAYADAVTAAVTVQDSGVAGRRGRGGYSPGNRGGDGQPGPLAATYVLP